jgi:alpha-glucoside transport system substrate-binding protein
MSIHRKGTRFRIALAGTVSVGLTLGMAACGDGDNSEGGDGTTASAAAIDCAQFSSFGDLKGKTVTIYTSIVTPEDKPHIDSYKPFEQCTGVTVKYEGDKAFETQVLVRAKAGNPPDIAYVPQPGLLKQLVATGKAVEAPQQTAANVDKFFGEDWKAYATVDGKFYGSPLSANVKSLVWYSPKEFEEKGLTPPKTLDELYTLSDKLAEGGGKPWCAGIGSGDATGWPITDWVEDMMLRLSGPENYDKWITHEIPFNDPTVVAAFEETGKILKNDKYVNGGLGDVKSIASTTFQDAGLKILDGSCSLHRQASFYASNLTDAGAEIAPDGDVFAFYLPGKDESAKPVLGGGEFVLAFNDRPEVKAFQTYLSSDVWATEKSKYGGTVVSANKGLKVEECKCTEVDKLAIEILQDPNATFRFDGSDLMPGEVGSNSFWKQNTAWITGQSTQETVDKIEKSWPKKKS